MPNLTINIMCPLFYSKWKWFLLISSNTPSTFDGKFLSSWVFYITFFHKVTLCYHAKLTAKAFNISPTWQCNKNGIVWFLAKSSVKVNLVSMLKFQFYVFYWKLSFLWFKNLEASNNVHLKVVSLYYHFALFLFPFIYNHIYWCHLWKLAVALILSHNHETDALKIERKVLGQPDNHFFISSVILKFHLLFIKEYLVSHSVSTDFRFLIFFSSLSLSLSKKKN